MYPAITDELGKITLWPEMFSFERLTEIRDKEIGNKAFSKEYLCTPLWTEDAYFKREQIVDLIDPGLFNLKEVISKDYEVFAGMDIGKVRHPSHLAVFMLADGFLIQIGSYWFDHWDYTKQVDFVNSLITPLRIRRIYFDATRGEFESFFEQGIIHRSDWVGVKFTSPEKNKMAAKLWFALISNA